MSDSNDHPWRKPLLDLVPITEPSIMRFLQIHDEITKRIAAIESLGIIDASPYYRDGTYLYLIHPMKDGKREREYIGKDPTKVREALDKVERFKKWQDLQAKLHSLNQSYQSLEHHLQGIQYELIGMERFLK